MKSEKNMFYPYNEEVLKNCYSLGVGGIHSTNVKIKIQLYGN